MSNSITTVNAEQVSTDIFVDSGSGSPVHAAYIACTFRPDRNLSVNLEVLDADAVATNMESVTGAVQAFLSEAFGRARTNGLPVPTIAV